jgi:hypothetical protein
MSFSVARHRRANRTAANLAESCPKIAGTSIFTVAFAPAIARPPTNALGYPGGGCGARTTTWLRSVPSLARSSSLAPLQRPLVVCRRWAGECRGRSRAASPSFVGQPCSTSRGSPKCAAPQRPAAPLRCVVFTCISLHQRPRIAAVRHETPLRITLIPVDLAGLWCARAR